MATESYTLVGSQLSPLQWVLAALLLLLIPKSYYSRRRIVPLAIVIPALGFLTALVRVPFPFYMIVSIVGFYVGIEATRPNPSPAGPKPPINPVLPMMPMLLMIPFAPIVMSSCSNGKKIQVEPEAIRIETSSKFDSLLKNEIDISFEKCSFQMGLQYAVYSSKSYQCLIYSDETYWNGHCFVGGDEVAKSMSAWSDVKLHPFVAGSVPRWPDPNDEARYLP